MIYIVRHGQTNWNVEGRYAGRIDVELNDRGRKQAQEIREKLKEVTLDAVISSPLIRAQETAKIISNRDTVDVDERIIERCNGDLEGMLKVDAPKDIDFNDPNETRYNIENIVDFKERIYDFFEEIKEKYKGKNVLIVTHAGVSIYCRCFFEGEPSDGNYMNYRLNNCEVLEYDN